MSTNSVMTPLNYSGVAELSNNVFEKTIARFGRVKFRDKLTGQLRTLVFDKKYFQDVIDSYKKGLMHQVPIQLATENNGHNMLPERFRGEIKELSICEEGLKAKVEATDDGAKIIRANPNLGTSVSILENFERQGRVVPKLLQHVLLTSDPQIVGMSPWKEVTLSNSGPNVNTIDLSEVSMTETNPQPNPNPTPEPNTPRPDPNPNPTPEPTTPAPNEPDPTPSPTPEDYTPTPEEEAIAERVFAEMVAAGELPDPDEDDESEEEDPVSPELVAANLANETRIAALEGQLAAQRWSVESAALIDAGVPPAQIALATDIMSQPQAVVVNLSNGTDVDATEVIRKMLQQQKGFVELSRELGNSFDPQKTPEQQEKAVLDSWDPSK